MGIQFNLIVAACHGGGIGFKGNLPWKLKNEMAYFTKVTTDVKADMKRNAVIMGRKTWESIPLKYRPLSKRLNVVLSKTLSKVDDGVVLCESLEKAIELLEQPLYRGVVETVWIIGGSSVYEAAMKSPNCRKIYFTDIKSKFECDAFFPQIPPKYVRVKDERVPEGIQEENGTEYEFRLYEIPSQE